MDPYIRRNLQRKLKMEALQLTSSGSRQTSRIEKHLSALHDAELAYEDFKAVNIGAKVPAKIRRQVLRKYLRECRQANIRKSMTTSTKETVKKNANGDTDTSLLLTIEDARDIMRSLETDTKESSTGKLTSRHRTLSFINLERRRRKEQDKNLSIFSTLQRDMPKLLDEALRLSRSLPPQEDKLSAKASSKPRSPSSPTSKNAYPGKARRGIDAFLERSHIMHNKKRLDRTLRQDLLAVLVKEKQ